MTCNELIRKDFVGMESYDEFWDNLVNLNDKDIANYEVFLSNDNRSSTIFPVFKKKQSALSIVM